MFDVCFVAALYYERGVMKHAECGLQTTSYLYDLSRLIFSVSLPFAFTRQPAKRADKAGKELEEEWI